jgi:hypothetical protein
MSTDMASAPTDRGVTLTIPAEYVDDFRDAVVFEIADGTDAVETNRKAIRDAADRRQDAWRSTCEVDWRSSVRLLAEDGVLLNQLEAAEPGQEFTASADDVTLAHACAAMAEKVVGRRVKDLLIYRPIDENVATELRVQLARLSWAIDNSTRLS